MVCVGMKPNGVDEEQVKLKAFPFSLKGAAKTWFFSILPGSIGTWNAMKKIFLEKVFPSISSCQHKERNMWDSTISWRDTFRVLGKI